MKNDCIFCKIANKEMESLTLYEDDVLMVIMDAFPNCDGHALVIPKKHYETIYDVDDETFIHMNKIAKQYGKTIMEKLDEKSMTFLINYGDAQVVKHLHLHLQPNPLKKATMDRNDVYNIIMR